MCLIDISKVNAFNYENKCNKNNIESVQAYDSVWREGLWVKLGRYGLGGKITTLLQSIYFNDSVRFQDLCRPIYLTRGVKQVNIRD